ncbi:Unknown protein, partial [Striga hermonthica]
LFGGVDYFSFLPLFTLIFVDFFKCIRICMETRWCEKFKLFISNNSVVLKNKPFWK